MTTTDTIDMTPPPASPPPVRRLRRSRSDRIGAGVSGGLGEYFGVDPVLFRVLFATAAFFGGAGVLGYLLAWAAIPDAGTERAAIDGWAASLRRHRVPYWLVLGVGALAFWIVAFSWWAPGPFFPVIAVVILLVVVFGRRGRRGDRAPAPLDPSPAGPSPAGSSPVGPSPVGSEPVGAEPVSLDKTAQPADGRPAWVHETRSWINESRQASQARRRRAFPVKIATLLTLIGTLVTIAVVDAVHGVRLPVYLWFTLAIVGAGLLTGIALRRAPWSVTTLLVPTVIGLVAFSGTHASLHDGIGQREWTPVATLDSHYDLGLGKATLDLRSLRPQTVAHTVHIEQAAGQVRIVAPKSLNLTVVANVHFGVVTLDGERPRDGDGGMTVRRVVSPLTGATGQAITVDVHLADGNVDVVRR